MFLLSAKTPHRGSRLLRFASPLSITALKLSPCCFSSASFLYTPSLMARFFVAIHITVYSDVYTHITISILRFRLESVKQTRDQDYFSMTSTSRARSDTLELEGLLLLQT